MPNSKNILSTTPKGYTPNTVTFDQNDFELEIKSHGRVVEVETALRCPCHQRTSGLHRVDCSNCFGSGWVFVDRRQTVALIQSMNQTNSKFKQYDLALAGHMSVTMPAKDRLCYMDIIRMTEHTVYHSELLRLRKEKDANVFYALSSFEIVEVDQALLFRGKDEPLLRLRKDVNFTVSRNKITFQNMPVGSTPDPEQYEQEGFIDVTVSVRYKHHPSWHIFDSLRVFAADIKEGCDSKFTEDLLPTHYIAVLPQRLADAPKYNGEETIDNSNEPEPTNNSSFGTMTI